uniref:Uncharacterized protein n=1 Tax=Candidatus Kentrum sp. LPFa TaxID=2126335 RepID=A0A450W830_9GAMM|nr:MAG: hypothetical protein BECKLPF1236B_GA0070989_104423 [Candidatus Kentron sp. LPFa]
MTNQSMAHHGEPTQERDEDGGYLCPFSGEHKSKRFAFGYVFYLLARSNRLQTGCSLRGRRFFRIFVFPILKSSTKHTKSLGQGWLEPSEAIPRKSRAIRWGQRYAPTPAAPYFGNLFGLGYVGLGNDTIIIVGIGV